VQGKSEGVTDMLYAAGLLANVGFDGGTFAEARQEDGGTIFDLNEYGRLLLQYAL